MNQSESEKTIAYIFSDITLNFFHIFIVYRLYM
jgi:hypothetical protein